MSLDSKNEKLVIVKDDAGVSRVVIDKNPIVANKDRVLSIRQDAESTDVITTVNTYQEVLSNFIAGTHKLVQKALFVKDMATQAGGVNTIPAYAAKLGDPPAPYITFQPGESAIVYYDDDVQTNGFGRPHWLKFLNDDTLGDLGITYVEDINRLKGRRNNVWYFVDNMETYEDYGVGESAIVFKRSDTDLETWRSEEDDLMDGEKLDALHNLEVKQLAPGTSGSPAAGFLTANYISQVPNLKVLEDLSDLTAGMTKEYTFPNGMTTDTVGGCEITLAYAKDGVTGAVAQGYDLRGWDTSRPIYLPITYHAGPSGTGNPIYSWLELKMEAVAGDNTKYSLTNFKSGTGATEINVFTVESIQFRGGE